MQQRGGIVLCWDKVGYHAGRMASMGGGRRILDRCSGTARPGEVLQRMPYVNLVCPHSSLSSYFEVVGVIGPSGAGKSTLLDILAGRQMSFKKNGEVLVGGSTWEVPCGTIDVFSKDSLP